MDLATFLLICIGGFFATYAHYIFALIADKIGLARLDFGKGLSMLLFGDSYDGKPPFMLGFLAVHLNGIFFSLIYSSVLAKHLPGSPLEKGLVWGAILFVFSQCIFNVFITKHGLFSLKMHPKAWQTAFIAHAIYGSMVGWLCPII